MKELIAHATTLVVALLLIFVLVTPVKAATMLYIPDEPGNEPSKPEPMNDSMGTHEQGTYELLATPIIEVWYEPYLKFGVWGNPQDQINILGNVRDPDGSVSSLSYRLNGGSSVSLDIGADTRRLARNGDFNAAIQTSALSEGSNTVVFTARDNSGGTTTKTISFPFSRTKTWPLPYSTRWSSAQSIQDQAEVVDGLWSINSSGVRVVQQGYDRLIAIGDTNWSNFEVLVPVTVHAFYPVGTDAGGVGIIARWQGHYGADQPPTSWDRLGSYAYYSNRLEGLALRINTLSPSTASFNFSLNTTYMFKLRAETASQGGQYSFKVWQKGQPEPSWNNAQFLNVLDTNGDLLQGSILLVAHRADATFGDVTICPLSGASYSLSVNQVGQGTVTKQPNKTSYSCGEGVTMTASAPSGWVFSNWSGDIQSTDPSISINVTRNSNITANFRQSSTNGSSKIFLTLLSR